MTRHRSPAHPDASLERAIELVGKLHARVRSNSVDRETAVREMGYSGMTGASGKTLANLVHFGLIAKAGKGGVRVTERAVDILHPKTPEDRRRALAQAGMTPAFYQGVRREFADGVPTENWLRSLMMRENFSDAAIAPAISAFLETVSFLQKEGAYESHGAPPPAPVDSDEIDELDEMEEMEANPEPIQPARQMVIPPRRNDKAAGPEERTVLTEEGAPGQYLVLRVAGEVTEHMLEALEDYVKRQRKRLQRS